MATTSTTEPTQEPSGLMSIGKLSREKFDSAQDFADDIAKNLIFSPAASASQSGSRITKETKVMPIPSGAGFIIAPFDATDCIINLVNNVSDSPTIGITTINGSRINLSASAPDGNYSISITRITVL